MSNYTDSDMTTNIKDLQDVNSNIKMKNFAKQIEDNLQNLPNSEYNNIAIQNREKENMYDIHRNIYFDDKMNNFDAINTKSNNPSEQNPQGVQLMNSINIIFSYIKEPIISTLIFTLLAHRKVTKLMSRNISFFDKGNNLFLSLMLRGLIFSIILIIIKHKLN